MEEGIVDPMDMALLQMLRLVQEVAVVGLVVAEGDMARVPRIEMALRLVGMIRAVEDALMMTETIVATIAAMETVMGHLVEAAAATWSR